MKFTPLQLPGAFLLEREVFTDERGSFARQFCRKEMLEHGLDFTMCQCNLSGNTRRGTLPRHPTWPALPKNAFPGA